jgi:hypothetical protein
MSKIHNYDDFLNEEFFRKMYGKVKKTDINACVDNIISFLNENDIYTWDDFINSRKLDRFIINQIIDKSTKNMKELEEVRFRLRLSLSNRQQLREYLQELEAEEKYEKCAEIVKVLQYK